MGRARIDLDGVALHDVANEFMAIAVFRYRTTEGLVLLIPESADELIPWSEVVSSTLDFGTGEIRIVFSDGFVERERWLRGARTLVGRWLDRTQLTAAAVLG